VINPPMLWPTIKMEYDQTSTGPFSLISAVQKSRLPHHYRVVFNWRHFRRHALRNGLQRYGRRGIFKIHGKEELKHPRNKLWGMRSHCLFKQVLEESDGGLDFSKTKFYIEHRKVD